MESKYHANSYRRLNFKRALGYMSSESLLIAMIVMHGGPRSYEPVLKDVEHVVGNTSFTY